MKNRVYCIILFFLMLLPGSCEKKPFIWCGVEHPEENLPWLKYILGRRFCTEIYTLAFEEIEYLVVSDCPGVIDGMIVFYDCQGHKTCEWGGINAGTSSCFMPAGFTYEYFEQNKKLIFKQL